MLKQWFFIAPVLMVLSACSGNKNSDFDGRWESACIGDKTYKLSAIFSLQFNGDVFESGIRSFSGTNCEQPTKEELVAGRFLIGSQSSSVEGAREVDFNPDLIRWTALDKDTSENLNAFKMCGISNWKEGESHDVTQAHGPTGCRGEEGKNSATAYSYFARTKFTIVKRDGEKMFIGQHGDSRQGRTADDRLTKLADFSLQLKR